jgi:hypothetical protein
VLRPSSAKGLTYADALRLLGAGDSPIGAAAVYRRTADPASIGQVYQMFKDSVAVVKDPWQPPFLCIFERALTALGLELPPEFDPERCQAGIKPSETPADG